MAVLLWARKGRQIKLLKKTSRKVSPIQKQPSSVFVHCFVQMIKRFQYLQQLLEASPNDSFVLFALAKEYEGQGDSSKTLEFYLRLKEADPNYVGLYYHLGKQFEKMEDYPNAIHAYKEGIEVSKKAGDRHAANELAGALLNLEDPDEA